MKIQNIKTPKCASLSYIGPLSCPEGAAGQEVQSRAVVLKLFLSWNPFDLRMQPQNVNPNQK